MLYVVETGNHRSGGHNKENAIVRVAQVGISFMQICKLAEFSFDAKHIVSRIRLGNISGAKRIASQIRLEIFSVLNYHRGFIINEWGSKAFVEA